MYIGIKDMDLTSSKGCNMGKAMPWGKPGLQQTQATIP